MFARRLHAVQSPPAQSAGISVLPTRKNLKRISFKVFSGGAPLALIDIDFGASLHFFISLRLRLPSSRSPAIVSNWFWILKIIVFMLLL